VIRTAIPVTITRTSDKTNSHGLRRDVGGNESRLAFYFGSADHFEAGAGRGVGEATALQVVEWQLIFDQFSQVRT
jgi:hypothetical protein